MSKYVGTPSLVLALWRGHRRRGHLGRTSYDFVPAELEPSCVRLNVRPGVVNEDYGSTKNDLSARIVAALHENEIAVAYP